MINYKYKAFADATAVLDINGQAIYGEDLTHEIGSAHQESKNISYTTEDVCYLEGGEDSGTPFFAIALDWSETDFFIPALTTNLFELYKKVNEVTMLGYNGDLDWTQSEKGLTITRPDEKPCDYEYCFVIY